MVNWKAGARVKTDAEIAHAELERIRQANGGELSAQHVVDASRDPSAPLHDEFLWDDAAAAEAHRRTQAQTIIRCLVVTLPEDKEKKNPVRAYSKPTAEGVASPYVRTEDLLRDGEARARLLQEALSKLMVWRAQYRCLNELAIVFRAHEEVLLAIKV